MRLHRGGRQAMKGLARIRCEGMAARRRVEGVSWSSTRGAMTRAVSRSGAGRMRCQRRRPRRGRGGVCPRPWAGTDHGRPPGPPLPPHDLEITVGGDHRAPERGHLPPFGMQAQRAPALGRCCRLAAGRSGRDAHAPARVRSRPPASPAGIKVPATAWQRAAYAGARNSREVKARTSSTWSNAHTMSISSSASRSGSTSCSSHLNLRARRASSQSAAP